MKRAVVACLSLLVVVTVLMIAGPAAASPSDPGACVSCHPIDTNVVVSTSFVGCSGTNARYQGTVSNSYGIAGWGLFRTSDNTRISANYGTLATFVVAPNATYTFQGVSAASMTLGGAQTVDFPVTANCANTIVITQADWSQSKKKLTVAATSNYGASAALQLVGYGAMTYNSKTRVWSKVVTITANPGTVTVSGPEGSRSATVTTVR